MSVEEDGGNNRDLSFCKKEGEEGLIPTLYYARHPHECTVQSQQQQQYASIGSRYTF